MGEKTATAESTIRGWIASGTYQPGDKIPSERTLAEELGIGRTTVRLILVRLVAEGTLQARHGSGYFVPESKRENAG